MTTAAATAASFSLDTSILSIASGIDAAAGDTRATVLNGIKNMAAQGFEVLFVGEPDRAILGYELAENAGQWMESSWKASTTHRLQNRAVSIVAIAPDGRECEVIVIQSRTIDLRSRDAKVQGSAKVAEKRFID